MEVPSPGSEHHPATTGEGAGHEAASRELVVVVSSNGNGNGNGNGTSKDKLRHVDIPSSSLEDSAALPVLRLVKNTTPKGLREVRNVLRWRVPNDHSSSDLTKHMSYNPNIDRPRSAPSASLSDPPEKIQRVNSFNKTSKPTTQKIKANNVHKRHWMYLYDNLHRAVDEMYKTCEQDFSIEQCSNVVHTMELCMEDFKRLAHKIKVQTELMNDETKRNKAIAWDEPYPRSAPSSVAPSPATPPRTPVLVPYIEPAMLQMVELEDNKYPQLDLPSVPLEHSISPSQLRRSMEAWGVSSDKDKDKDHDTDGTTEGESETEENKQKNTATEKESEKENERDNGPGTETDTDAETTDTDKEKGKEDKESLSEKESEKAREEALGLTSVSDSKSDTSSNSDMSGNLPWAERLKRSLSHLAPPASTYKKVLQPTKSASTKQRKPISRSVSSDQPKRTIHEEKPRKNSKHRSPQNEARLRQDEKQAKASKNREQYVNSKKEKVALALSRVKDVTERQSQKIIQRQLSIEEKQEKAIIIHEAHIDRIYDIIFILYLS